MILSYILLTAEVPKIRINHVCLCLLTDVMMYGDNSSIARLSSEGNQGGNKCGQHSGSLSRHNRRGETQLSPCPLSPVIPVPCPMLHKETQERGQRLDRGGKGDGGPLVMHGEGDRVTNEYF